MNKNNKYLIVLLTLIFSLFFPLAISGKESVKTNFILNDSFQKEVKERNLYIFEVSPDELKGERSLDNLKTKDSNELIKLLGEPYKKITTIDRNNIALSLEEKTYIALEEIVDKDNGKYRSFSLFTLPNNKDIISKIENNSNGKVILKKIDKDSKVPLKGVVFRLFFDIDNPLNSGEEISQVTLDVNKSSYKREGKIFDLTTDDNGLIEIDNLPTGKYLFREEEALSGYSIDKKDINFEIQDKQTTNLTIENTKGKNSFHFKKVDSNTKEPLKGARFILAKEVNGEYENVYNENNKKVILESDDEGNFSVNNLDYGEYYLWEVEAPDGYRLLNEPISFEVNSSSGQYVKEIENEKFNPPERPPDWPKNRKTKDIPKTGDISIILMTLFGLILIILGKLIIREEKNGAWKN